MAMPNDQNANSESTEAQIGFPSWWHHDPVEILAVAMEESFFAPHEYPIGRPRHEKFRQAARAAIGVLRDD